MKRLFINFETLPDIAGAKQLYGLPSTLSDKDSGKVLDALARSQLDRNTIVVLWGDHGFALGETNRWCKATNFELDTRVPLLIRTPDLPQPGVATDALVEMVDVYPTLVDVAGLEAPVGLDGRSFAPILNNPQLPGRDVVLSQFNRPWKSTTPQVMGYSIRTQGVRYTRWLRWDSREVVAEELYDYSPPEGAKRSVAVLLEEENVASGKPALLDRMRAQMETVLASRRKIGTRNR